MSFYDTGEPWARNGTESHRLYTKSSTSMQSASTDDELQIIFCWTRLSDPFDFRGLVDTYASVSRFSKEHSGLP